MCGHLTMTKPNQEVPNRLFGMAVKTPTQEMGSMETEIAPLSSSLCLSGTSSLPYNKPSVEEYPLPSELLAEDDNGLSVDLGGVGNLCGNNAVKSQEMAQGNMGDTVPDP